jgi:hypothetical protein
VRLPSHYRLFRVYLALLRCAALLAPAHQRREWWKEWSAELWYVWQQTNRASGITPAGLAEVAGFCRGAFADAFWLRRFYPRLSSLSSALSLASPVRCILLLAGLVAATLLLALRLPDARNALQPLPNRGMTKTLLIARYGFSEAQFPTVRLEEYREWQVSTHAFFSELAFYQPATKRVRIAPHKTVEMRVARGTANLLDLLHVPAALRIAGASANTGRAATLPSIVLSEAVWRERFRADPSIVGRIIQVAGEDAIVSSVVPDAYWQLPGNLDAWIFYRDQRVQMLPPDTRGFVLAHQRDSASTRVFRGPWRLSVPNSLGQYDVFVCTPVAARGPQPFSSFIVVLVLAILALPATTSLPLGEYPAKHGSQPISIRLRRWIFLLVKILLVVPAVYLATLDLAYLSAGFLVQIAFPFAGCLFALRWVLRDQRQRCPVCLRLLKNPARVGQPSRNFLAWNGTELMCEAGHGLLHVPEIATSWFSTQRWLYLDPSWQSLFSAPLVS